MTALQPPRGTHDLLPPESERFQALERLGADTFEAAGFSRIITPMFEDTALIHRGTGEQSEIVQKETYTFLDRSGNSLTLRPDGTVPVMRAIVSAHLWDQGLPIKVHYSAAMFRYERPQKGRVRQHHQLGIEAVGSEAPTMDADVIAIGWELLERAGVGEVSLLLNSMGHRECRAAYLPRFVEAMRGRRDRLSEDSQRRLEQNPLRIWDSKDAGDQAALAGVPTLADSLCDACAEHFAAVRGYLEEWRIPYELAPGLVRGFDYYTRTTFEYQSRGLVAAQNALGGGGRYDGLVEEIGGPALPGIGFGIGLERVLLAQEAAGTAQPSRRLGCYVAPLRAEDESAAMLFVRAVRAAGGSAALAHEERNAKAHLKHANKIAARTVALIGEQEAAASAVTLKDMDDATQETLAVEAAVARVVAKEEDAR